MARHNSSRLWSVRVQLGKPSKTQREAVRWTKVSRPALAIEADTDPDSLPGCPGDTCVWTVQAVAEHVLALIREFHSDRTVWFHGAADAVRVAGRIGNAVSVGAGKAVWSLPYMVDGPAGAEAWLARVTVMDSALVERARLMVQGHA